MEDKPSDITEYENWLTDKFDISLRDLAQAKGLYENVSVVTKDKFQNSEFWIQLSALLRDWNDEYLTLTGYLLFAEGNPKLIEKPYDSFFLKTYRKNVLENRNWPLEPNGGWYLPSNWIVRVKDVVRTLLVVKYLDGVDFLTDKIQELSQSLEICGSADVSFEARDHGYYAAHMGIPFKTEMLNLHFINQPVVVNIEIQVTTQLQDVIRKLTHKFYENRRQEDIVEGDEDRSWQWRYRDPEFVPNYLGHLLHFVEGMIMEVREKEVRNDTR